MLAGSDNVLQCIIAVNSSARLAQRSQGGKLCGGSGDSGSLYECVSLAT